MPMPVHMHGGVVPVFFLVLRVRVVVMPVFLDILNFGIRAEMNESKCLPHFQQ